MLFPNPHEPPLIRGLIISFEFRSKSNRLLDKSLESPGEARDLECADLSALWSVATCRGLIIAGFFRRMRRQAAADQGGD